MTGKIILLKYTSIWDFLGKVVSHIYNEAKMFMYIPFCFESDWENLFSHSSTLRIQNEYPRLFCMRRTSKLDAFQFLARLQISRVSYFRVYRYWVSERSAQPMLENIAKHIADNGVIGLKFHAGHRSSVIDIFQFPMIHANIAY